MCVYMFCLKFYNPLNITLVKEAIVVGNGIQSWFLGIFFFFLVYYKVQEEKMNPDLVLL